MLDECSVQQSIYYLKTGTIFLKSFQWSGLISGAPCTGRKHCPTRRSRDISWVIP